VVDSLTPQNVFLLRDLRGSQAYPVSILTVIWGCQPSAANGFATNPPRRVDRGDMRARQETPVVQFPEQADAGLVRVVTSVSEEGAKRSDAAMTLRETPVASLPARLSRGDVPARLAIGRRADGADGL
jgi:hypothetical protein